MTTAITRLPFSGSADGQGIKVAATGSPGTLVHTAHATATDEVWLWCVNSSASAVKLTVQFGGTTDPDDSIEAGIDPESGLFLIVPGLVLSNSKVVRAFAATANVLVVHGYVNRLVVS